MRVYIDEAGPFVVPRTGSESYSLVLALVIPSANEAKLFFDFLRLRDSWPVVGVEIKGSSLDEKQTAQVLEVLLRHDVLMEFVALNMATHDHMLVEDYKTRQADALLAPLTPQHKLPLVQAYQKMSDGIRKMPDQLFLQAFVTIILIFEILKKMTLYYVQRMPEELGDISWIIDRKDRTITQMEEMWSTLITPLSETRYAREHLPYLVGADYSHFYERYGFTKTDIDPQAASHIEWLRNRYGLRPFVRFVDCRRLFKEQRDFKDSRDSLGLQLADILATTLRRALNGNLRIAGWKRLGGLLVRREDLSDPCFIQLGSDSTMSRHAARVRYVLDTRAKPMLVGE